MHALYLGLGSNLGNKEQNISRAIEYIEELIGNVTRRSALYFTEPWGFVSSNKFVNAVVCVDTALTPAEALRAILGIEREMGRKEKSVDGQYKDRLIDIDILLYDDMQIDETDLKVPHPLMFERNFVMRPLSEVLDDRGRTIVKDFQEHIR
ncbi:MAG: 2-amino-4-hydroxy-6-hydroxymethyldihydropteridine diphosphokinase [Prevotellaceae bacterium]|nr:2-amino-4-hydroxy-6-hydroxymethyldihydropteridine diphosphokinase [Prevotellaceae bacterium]